MYRHTPLNPPRSRSTAGSVVPFHVSRPAPREIAPTKSTTIGARTRVITIIRRPGDDSAELLPSSSRRNLCATPRDFPIFPHNPPPTILYYGPNPIVIAITFSRNTRRCPRGVRARRRSVSFPNDGYQRRCGRFARRFLDYQPTPERTSIGAPISEPVVDVKSFVFRFYAPCRIPFDASFSTIINDNNDKFHRSAIQNVFVVFIFQ